MFQPIDRFFYLLTLQNWGFPWHIILCWGAVDLGQIWFPLKWVAPVVFAVGVLYEIYQVYQYRKRAAYSDWDYKRDAVQDLVADTIGILLGVFL